MKDLILLVEDDEQYGEVVRDFLEANGLSVEWVTDGEIAIGQFNKLHPRIILLDVVLPGKDGFEVATEIRKSNTAVPIIFMTGTALDNDNYNKAYKSLGAINYIEKPINPHNILAQIQSLLYPASTIKKHNINNHCISIDSQLLTINSKEIQLRDKEIQVLSILLDNINLTVNRNDIMNLVWDINELKINNALDKAISRIRNGLKHFSAIEIRTIYGVGYKLSIK